MGLQLVHAREVACWPWALGWLTGEPVQGATCRTCGLDVAQPTAQARNVPVCIYCGMDSGLLPEEDAPLSFGPLTTDPTHG